MAFRAVRINPSAEIEMRAQRSLAAIAVAKEYDADQPKGRGSQSAQLWELARHETAAFFGELSDRDRLARLLEPGKRRGGYRHTLGQIVADLKVAQTLLSSEMLFLLTSTGYKPPPPAHKLISDTSDIVIRAVTASAAYEEGDGDEQRAVMSDAPFNSQLEQSLASLATVHRRLVDLEGKSAKRVRREVSRLHKSVAVLGSAAIAIGTFVGTAAVAEPAKDAIKTVVEHQINQIPGLEGIDFGGPDNGHAGGARPAAAAPQANI
jgi:hypothetical protein